MEEDKAAEKSAKSDNTTSEKHIAEKDTENKVTEGNNGRPENTQKESTQNVDKEKENDEKENEEIDIYLFSNGQKYSPPRKYHLRADDLTQWKSTLGFLARKHYGSLHSAIELFELDGRKVEDSKYIRDCAVYVAVVPPDSFIYAGYDKYLIKASKSFERRLSKITNSGAPEESSNPDDAHKNDTNRSKLSQDATPAPRPVKSKELRAQHPSTRKNNEVRRSTQKNVNLKFADKMKPVANQVSQRPILPRKLNFKSDSVPKKTAVNKKENPSCSPTRSTTPRIPRNDSLLDRSTDKGKTPYLPELYACDHSLHKDNESPSVLAHNNNNIIKTYGSTDNRRKTSKPIYKNMKAKGDTLVDVKTANVDAVYKKRLDSPKGPKFKAHTPVPKNIIKQSAENANLDTDAKLVMGSKGKVSEITKKAVPEVEMQGFPSTSLRFNLTHTRASMVDTSNITLNECTALNAVNLHENDEEKLQKMHSSLKSDDTKHTHNGDTTASTAFQGKMSTNEGIPKLHVPDIARKFEEKAILINSKNANYDKINITEYLKYKTIDTNESCEDADNSDKFAHYALRPQIPSISKIKPIPESRPIETILVKEINNNKTKCKSPTNAKKLNVHDGETKSFFHGLEVPLYPVLEKPNKHVNNTVNSEPSASKDQSIISDDSNDTSNRTLNANGTKIHSYTFLIKKDDVNNTIKATDVKTMSKETEKSISVPLNNMVKNEDIVHINVYRYPFGESFTMEENAAKQNEKTQYIYLSDTTEKSDGTVNNNRKSRTKSESSVKTDTTEKSNGTVKGNSKNRNDAKSSEKILVKEAETKTTFMNQKWEESSYDPPSKVSYDPATQFVDRSDTVNLKLSIDIRNAEGILKSNQKINIEKSNNQRNIENSNNIQSDIDEDDSIKSPNELTQSKSFQSIEDDTPHLCCRKDKVVVYQCACCNRSGAEISNNFTAKPLFPGQGFYFLLPVAMPAQDSVRAPCQTCDKQVQHTESLIKTNLDISNQETLISVPGDGDKPTSIKLSNTSQSIKFENVVIESQVGKMDQEVDPSRMIMMRTDPSQTSSRCNLECKQQQTSSVTQDQCTQTDWADVLLEARAEQDGHYTFYLPPLQVLQKYTFR